MRAEGTAGERSRVLAGPPSAGKVRVRASPSVSSQHTGAVLLLE